MKEKFQWIICSSHIFTAYIILTLMTKFKLVQIIINALCTINIKNIQDLQEPAMDHRFLEKHDHGRDHVNAMIAP